MNFHQNPLYSITLAMITVGHKFAQLSWHNIYNPWLSIDGLVQERRNSSALAMELRLSCTNPSVWSFCFMREHHNFLRDLDSELVNGLWDGSVETGRSMGPRESLINSSPSQWASGINEDPRLTPAGSPVTNVNTASKEVTCNQLIAHSNSMGDQVIIG